MDLFTRLLSLRRRGRRQNLSPSRSSGSSFEYGQPPVNRASGDFDPHQFLTQPKDYTEFARNHLAGIPIRSTTPRSFPLLEHPIDHVPRRDPNAPASSPSVRVHRKMILQRTEFPLDNPQRSPRKQPFAESTPLERGRSDPTRTFRRVESVYSDSSDEQTSNSPRLDMLRQDPSVLSLVSVMDSHGSIPSEIFTNSPATPHPASRGHRRRRHPFFKSTPDLSTGRTSCAQNNSSNRNTLNSRIKAAPETPSARPRSEFPLPSFPLHIFPSKKLCVTPESHSFSSLQCEQGSFSFTGNSSKKPVFSTHKSLTKASDAFRFLQDRYNKALPPTPVVHNPRGPSVNDAVAESSSTAKTAAISRTPQLSFVHEPGRQTLPLTDTTYNLSPRNELVCFSSGVDAFSGHISHSITVSPLSSPLPVLTRIHPYSSSFSRGRRGTNHSSSDETTAPTPSRSLSESSHCSLPSSEMSPKTPLTLNYWGSPVHSRMRPTAIVVSPSVNSAYEHLQNKMLKSGYLDADFAEEEIIRTSRALHTTSANSPIYGRHVPARTERMCEDPHAQIGLGGRTHIPAREARVGLGISFDFNLGNDFDSVGDGLDDDQEITPGRPTVVLVPSEKWTDRGELSASTCAPASVNLELEREECGPRFAPGLAPQFPLESGSQSSQSCGNSFYTAQEAFVEPELASSHLMVGHGDGHARRDASGTPRRASGTPRHAPDFSPKPRLGLSSNTLVAASIGPATDVSSSSRLDHPHHGLVDTMRESRGWSSTSSLTESSRDEYSRFATMRRAAPLPWSQFVSPSPERL